MSEEAVSGEEKIADESSHVIDPYLCSQAGCWLLNRNLLTGQFYCDIQKPNGKANTKLSFANRTNVKPNCPENLYEQLT